MARLSDKTRFPRENKTGRDLYLERVSFTNEALT